MKVKVLIPFRDRVTGKTYKAGETVDLSAKRINEITAKGKYIQLVEDEKPTTPATKA